MKRNDLHTQSLPGPIPAEGLLVLLDRLADLGLDPTPGVDGTWTAECPGCRGVLFIDPAAGELECKGAVA